MTFLRVQNKLFFHEVLTSKCPKKFFRSRGKLCKVSKRYAKTRALQRTNSRGHATSESFFYLEKIELLGIFAKIKAKRTPLKVEIRVFFHEVLTSKCSKIFFKGRGKPCEVFKRYNETRASQRTNSRGHTTSESFFICKKRSNLAFLTKSRSKSPSLMVQKRLFFMKF